jgi:hypothetical protein
MHAAHKLKISVTCLLVLIFICTAGVPAEAARIVQGTIIDIYNDETVGEAYVTIKTPEGPFIIDCKSKSFATPIAPGDYVKVSVKNIRALQKKTVGDLVAVMQHTPAQH